MSEGQFAAYPRKPVREIDFAVISEGFSIVTKNWLAFSVATVVLLLIGGVFQLGMYLLLMAVVGSLPTGTQDMNELMSYMVKEYAIFIPGGVLMYAGMSPVMLSYCMMTFKHLRGEPIEIGDVALGFGKIGQAAIVTIITYVLSMLGICACYFGFFWVGGRLMLSLPALADKGLAPMESVRESWVLTAPHMWMAMLLYFVLYLIAPLGVIACCIGVLVTFPLLYVCTTLVYRDLSGMTTGSIAPQPDMGVAPTEENQEPS